MVATKQTTDNVSRNQLGTAKAALAEIASILVDYPELCAEQVREILCLIPEYPPALLLLASAYRLSGDPMAALHILEPLTKKHVKSINMHFEYGLALAAVGRNDEAITCFRRTVALNPEHAQAWRLLGDHLLAMGDQVAAHASYLRHVSASSKDPLLLQAANAMWRDNLPVAERLLKQRLMQAPTDIPAIRMLAEVAVRLGQEQDAEHLLERCLQLAPDFTEARFNYAVVLHRRDRSAEAIQELEQLLQSDPRNPSFRNLLAVALSRIGEYSRSREIYAELLREYPANSKVWLSYGHVLKTLGQQGECVDSYRRSIEYQPAFGEAYWSLANLKTFRFSEADLATMQAQLLNTALTADDRLQLHFALGKAYEDQADYTLSFQHYAQGNKLSSDISGYSAHQTTERVKRLKHILTQEFFIRRSDSGCRAPDPIFIVGMPRAGSTLLEQILSSHSQIEGTSELPVMIALAKELRSEAGKTEIAAYAEVLASRSAAELKELGERYLEQARIYRKTDRPFFIDKMPNNFIHIGLIQAVLPNAKIIDARRHPLGCCFSNFKQYYARGQNFSYSLKNLGRYYRDYVELMAHFGNVLPPGRIHRVFYEHTITDTEAVVREVLAYCGLEFEPQCLRFYESQRPVRTASSEQVRRPISSQGAEQWLHYEHWLEPLKRELGAVLERYPDVPEF